MLGKKILRSPTRWQKWAPEARLVFNSLTIEFTIVSEENWLEGNHFGTSFINEIFDYVLSVFLTLVKLHAQTILIITS